MDNSDKSRWLDGERLWNWSIVVSKIQMLSLSLLPLVSAEYGVQARRAQSLHANRSFQVLLHTNTSSTLDMEMKFSFLELALPSKLLRVRKHKAVHPDDQ